jgi:hypothetical protein
MADADRTVERLPVEALDQVGELTAGTPALDPAFDQRCDTRGIVAAVFEAPQPVNQTT